MSWRLWILVGLTFLGLELLTPGRLLRVVLRRRRRPLDLRIGEPAALVCWGVIPSGTLRHPLLRTER